MLIHSLGLYWVAEAPVLTTQRSVVSVYEGSDVQLTCILRDNYLPSNEITWLNNHRQEVWDTSKKYLLQRAAAWANLTVREADEMHDSGQYWCSASNAVGGAEIPITLRVMSKIRLALTHVSHVSFCLLQFLLPQLTRTYTICKSPPVTYCCQSDHNNNTLFVLPYRISYAT